MKNKELKSILKTFPDDMEIVVEQEYGDAGIISVEKKSVHSLGETVYYLFIGIV